MNKQIKDEGLTCAYLLGKSDGYKQGNVDGARKFAKWLCSKHLSIDTTRNCFVNTNNFTFDIDSVIAEWQKEVEG